MVRCWLGSRGAIEHALAGASSMIDKTHALRGGTMCLVTGWRAGQPRPASALATRSAAEYYCILLGIPCWSFDGD